MLSSLLITGLSALAAAAPLAEPQNIDFDLVYELPEPTYTIATGVASQVVRYDPSTIIAFAAAQITSEVDPTDTPTGTAAPTLVSALQKRGACAVQPTGATGAPKLTADTPAAFTSSPALSSIAVNAPVPSGYNQRFSNLKAANQAYGYMGFVTLQTYDTNACAAKCSAVKGCTGFNIYFERDPTLDPGPSCANPPSVTMIKCVFWGGPVNNEGAVNTGQMRQNFQVVIAGSNGYESALAAPPGYGQPVALNGAINAPLDSLGFDTYLGVALFNSGPFDLKLCADACTLKSQYARAHPPSDGSPVVTCQFFNTYLIYINNTQNPQGQYCAMYAESWAKDYATNTGQWRGNDQFLIRNSYAVSNATDPGNPIADRAVAQAVKDISWNTLQPYCSGLAPASTVTTTTTTTATSASTVTVTNTLTSGVALSKRSLPTGTAVQIMPPATTSAAIWRRDVAVPNVLAKYPSSVVTSACLKYNVTGSVSTVTVTETATTTGPVMTQTLTTTATTSCTNTGNSAATTSSGSAATPTTFLMQVVNGTYAGQYLGKDGFSRMPDYNMYALTSRLSSAVPFTLSSPLTATVLMQGDWIVQGARTKLNGRSYGGFAASAGGFEIGENLLCTVTPGTVTNSDGTKSDGVNCATPENGFGTVGECDVYPWLWLFASPSDATKFCPGGTGALYFRTVDASMQTNSTATSN